MLVKDIMSDNVSPLHPENTLLDVIRLFESTRSDVAPVMVNSNTICGVVTKRILYRALLNGYSLEHSILPLVNHDIVTLTPEDTSITLKLKMTKNKVTSAVVINKNNQYAGMVSKVDLIRGLQIKYETFADELLAVVDAIQNGIIAINSSGNITLINPAAENLLGVQASRIIDKPVSKVIPEFFSQLNFFSEKEVQSSTWYKRIIKNKVVMFKYSPIYYRNEEGGGLIVLYDLTDFEQIARELESVKGLQKTLESILEIAYDGIIVTNEQGLITMTNKTIAEFLGKKSDQLIGKQIDKFLNLTLYKKDSISEVKKIKNRECLITQQPMIQDDKLSGFIVKVTFRGLDQLKDALLRVNTLERQVNYYKSELKRFNSKQRFGIDNIIGHSEVIASLKNQARQAAKGFSNILLLGESGTGKGLFAKAIHNESRRVGPFVTINCASIPDNLLESELFGYAEGAFTGAKKGGRSGKFEHADHGTLFLDEIGDMSLALQAKILRALQDKEFERIGSTKTIKVNVKIIAATNKNLEDLVNRGQFREDLYYRLNVIPLRIPPLRERKEDIKPIAEYIINNFNDTMGTRVTGISSEAMAILRNYDWPGNIRELENTIERAINLNPMGVIEAGHLPDILKITGKMSAIFNHMNRNGYKNELNYKISKEKGEREVILIALKETRGNKSKAAKLLGICRSTLYLKLAKYNLNP